MVDKLLYFFLGLFTGFLIVAIWMLFLLQRQQSQVIKQSTSVYYAGRL
jgi:uncharacterized membrane protein required for colicin V production